MKYQNCLEISVGSKFKARVSGNNVGDGYLTTVSPDFVIARRDNHIVCDAHSVSFDIISGYCINAFGEMHSAGDFIFLGLEDLFMEVTE